MFKGKKGTNINPHAMMKAQELLEAATSTFERREFTAEVDGVKAVLSGKRELLSVDSGPDSVRKDLLMKAYEMANHELTHERHLTLVRIRNQVTKEFRVDIKGAVPDVAEAVAYMDKRQSAS